MSTIVGWFEYFLALPFFWIGVKIYQYMTRKGEIGGLEYLNHGGKWEEINLER